jgi:hypothetical protein
VAPHSLHHPKEAEDLNAVGGHCPRCGAEYRPGFDTCADCGLPLVPGPAPGTETVPEGVDAWKEANERLWNADGTPRDHKDPGPADVVALCSLPWEEAWLMAGRLRAEGIPAIVYPDDYTPFSPYGITRSSFDVMIRRDQLEEARRVVEQIHQVR